MGLLQSNLLARYAVFLLYLSSLVCGAVVTYDFNITWVTTNPDGAFQRSTIGINDQWPIPQIRAAVGDSVVVNVNNQLGNQSTSLHFHGLFMNGSTHMDGPVGTSQCSIPPGSSFRYEFKVDQPGTYWYHSHDSGQYPDGLRGALIVEDPKSPYKSLYDEEIILTVSDWYHDQMRPLLKNFVSVINPTGAEPVPNGALMNDTQNMTIPVEAGKTYMFRMINMGAFAGQYLWFEGHTMRIVEVDGIYTEPAEADMIYITTAQRYSVLVTMKNNTDSNFAIVGSMDQTLFDTIPPGLNPNVTGWLLYDKTKDIPPPALLDDFDAFDDFTLVPTDGMETYDSVDHSITLDVKMDNLGDGANYAFFNNITYVRPKVPTLYSVMSSGPLATNSEIYGTNTNAFILKKNEIVEIILNNNDGGRHPFHLHGHTFQTVARSEEEAGFYNGNVTLPKVPMRRDTIMVNPNGNIVLRFKADNPDKYPPACCVWLFHCHIEWHVASGLVVTMIEAPEELQKSLSIPQEHLQVCHEQGLPTSGNAAGNTKDLLDLTGANLSPAPLPAGFTARGIVALVFSCLSAILGMAAIAWYGVGEIGASELASAKKRIAKAGIGL